MRLETKGERNLEQLLRLHDAAAGFCCTALNYERLTAIIKCCISLILSCSRSAVATTHFKFQSNFQLSFNLISFHLHPMVPAGSTCRVKQRRGHVRHSIPTPSGYIKNGLTPATVRQQMAHVNVKWKFLMRSD